MSLRPQIIIADDDRELLTRTAELIRKEFEVAACVADGSELVLAARALHPDLIISDISMPRMNGLRAIARVREEQPDARAILLSSYGDAEFVREARARKINGYVRKTCLFNELLPAIHAVLAGATFYCPELPS